MKMSMDHWWDDTDRGKQNYCEENLCPVSLGPPQILHGLSWDRSRGSSSPKQRPNSWCCLGELRIVQKRVLCTHLALQKVTLGNVQWTVQRKVRRLLTWRPREVLRPQNGPLCVHWVAALSGRLTSVKGTHTHTHTHTHLSSVYRAQYVPLNCTVPFLQHWLAK